MKYQNVCRAFFLDRPNRFIAHVDLDGKVETVHVKNTGRCKELLVHGAEVFLTAPGTSGRKTTYDLIAVRKSGGILFNIDSQAANKAAQEWLEKQPFERLIPEFSYGSSRIDFYMERENKKYLMEVKGCTLEVDGIGYFPDAPTERGVKHIHELISAVRNGYQGILAYVIQMDGVKIVRPNLAMHPEFGRALSEAEAEGVRILYLPCHVEPDELFITADPM